MRKAVLSAIALAAIAGGTAVAQQSGHAGHRQPGGMTMQATPANPYPPAEMRMHEKMMAAVGADATETWVRKMIEHHRGGIEMSRIVLRETRDARVRQMATKTIADQRGKSGSSTRGCARAASAPSDPPAPAAAGATGRFPIEAPDCSGSD